MEAGIRSGCYTRDEAIRSVAKDYHLKEEDVLAAVERAEAEKKRPSTPRERDRIRARDREETALTKFGDDAMIMNFLNRGLKPATKRARRGKQ